MKLLRKTFPWNEYFIIRINCYKPLIDLIEFPKKVSKILAGIKHEEEVGARRAQNFMNKCEQIAELREQRKHGSIADKDLSKFPV